MIHCIMHIKTEDIYNRGGAGTYSPECQQGSAENLNKTLDNQRRSTD